MTSAIANPARRRTAPSRLRRAAEDWRALEPRGAYARRVRGPCLALALVPLLLVALPLAGALAGIQLALFRDPRRILFAQPRVGRRGRLFVLLKFRTMDDGPGSDGVRVTRFGRFLRNTHLDELPQLWNVLRRDMDLVGPRPEMVATERWAARVCPGFSERLVLRPGLTGLAQVTQGYAEGGDRRAYRRKQALNRCYRRGLSLRLDALILLRTVVWMLRARGWRHGAARAGAQPRARP